MLVDFHHHFTPGMRNPLNRKVHTNYLYGIPISTEHGGLTDISAHIRMMDETGIDVSVLTSGRGIHGKLLSAKNVNEELSRVCREYPDRLHFLIHYPAPAGRDAIEEVEKWIHRSPGVVVPSSFGGANLDSPELDGLFDLLTRNGKYLFVHPAIVASKTEASIYNSYDLYRTVGREFSLVVATVRLICSGVLDRFAKLKIVMSHLGGGISSLLPRIIHYQDKNMWGVSTDPKHGKTAAHEFDYYLKNRIYFDTAGFFGERSAIESALVNIPKDRILLGTDYPQEIRDPEPVRQLIISLKHLGVSGNGKNLLCV
jgi:predicted TIM-barrel fold metal-dependent hydrolase